MRRFAAVPLLLFFLGTACSSDSPAPMEPPPAPPSTAGTWEGTLQNIFQLRFTLVENSGGVTGSGTFTVPGDQVAVNVNGTHVFPNVSMTITPSGFQAMNFQGVLAGDGRSITGTVSGSGFNNQGLTLSRQ